MMRTSGITGCVQVMAATVALVTILALWRFAMMPRVDQLQDSTDDLVRALPAQTIILEEIRDMGEESQRWQATVVLAHKKQAERDLKQRLAILEAARRAAEMAANEEARHKALNE